MTVTCVHACLNLTIRMGVKDLWKVLEPRSEPRSVPLKSLQGKTLAVDLSGWIVEFRTNQNFHHLYLRTLYQRVTRLMKQGIKLVFVADGKAPEWKQKAMARRRRDEAATNNLNRAGLKFNTEKCFEVLEALGLPCIQAPGEAEAYCAWLNGSGRVDGILTSDSDVFLYGGKTVYKDLEEINKFEYKVDVYEMKDIEEKLGLTRETMIAMAIFVGCDYDDGVENIGIKKAQELMRELRLNELDPLTRIRGWKENEELKRLSKSNERKMTHCQHCRHKGTKLLHDKDGCCDCNLEQSCDQSSEAVCSCVYHTKLRHKLELRYYEKSMQNMTFSDNKWVDEFLHASDGFEEPTLTWKTIDVSSLKCQILEKWILVEEKVDENIVKLLIQLQMTGQSSLISPGATPHPVKIIKECKQNHVQCFEVQWAISSTGATQTETVEQTPFRDLYGNIVQKYREEKEEAEKRKQEEKRGKKRRREEKGQSSLMTDFFQVKKKPAAPH